MTSVNSMFDRAVALHREALFQVQAAKLAAGVRHDQRATLIELDTAQRELAVRLRDLADAVAPGWLSCHLDRQRPELPLGTDATVDRPTHVRLGEARLGPGRHFPVVVPFLGVGHLAIDADATDPRVAGWLRSLMLRLLAALPPGTLRVLPVDAGSLGTLFGAFRPMIAEGTWRTPATDLDGLRTALSEAEAQITEAQVAPGIRRPYLLLVCATLPVGAGPAEWARLAAVAHAGPAARVHLLIAGYPPPQPAGMSRPPRPADTVQLVKGESGGLYWVSEAPGGGGHGDRFSRDGSGLAAPVSLDPGPPDEVITTVCRAIAAAESNTNVTTFSALMPGDIWRESSATGIATPIGRDQSGECVLRLDDATPHWLVSGRTGSGKTIFLLDALYGLASRYSPDELALYLLDFKEGVSFAEFTPTPVDPSWIPHARTVGIESDREYGVAVLRALSAEMGRRATLFKQAGVTRLADLRSGLPDVAMPRLVAVIDEFHVLFTGNDRTAGVAAALLEELARKGRSYGIHLILASQTISGVEALFTKTESIFGQFPLRVALAGGGGILEPLNNGADALPLGTAVINVAAGVAGANRLVRFPNADPVAVTVQRHALWQARPPGDEPPAVFAGYAEHHVVDDPTFQRLGPSERPRLIVGRSVDVGLPTATFGLDSSPGRHLAVLGTSLVGADVLHAAALGLAHQHAPGSATFLIAPLVAAADGAARDLIGSLRAAGHRYRSLTAVELRQHMAVLAATLAQADSRHGWTYLIVFGADAASASLAVADPDTFRTGLDDLRTVLRQGPSRGVHLLGWWRGLRRLSDDIGGSAGQEDLACLVALNVPGSDLASFLGDYQLSWAPRPNRALLVDHHEDRRSLIVPFVRPGTYERIEELP